MGSIRLAISLKFQVSFAEYRLFYKALLQKRPIILRSLLIEGTPYMWLAKRMVHDLCVCVHVFTCVCQEFLYSRVCVGVRVYIYENTHIQIQTHTYKYTHTQTNTHTQWNTHISTHLRTHTHTHIHTRTHTHTHIPEGEQIHADAEYEGEAAHADAKYWKSWRHPLILYLIHKKEMLKWQFTPKLELID